MYKHNICIMSEIIIIVQTSMGVLADMSAAHKKSYGWQPSFCILSTFSYDIWVGWAAGQHNSTVWYVSFYWNLFIIVWKIFIHFILYYIRSINYTQKNFENLLHSSYLSFYFDKLDLLYLLTSFNNI